MKEKDVQSRFTKWLRENNYPRSAAFELKLCKGNNALSFASFQPQQIPCLSQAKHGTLAKKLSDLDPSLKPFDCFVLAHCEAYVVACWHHEGKGVTAYWIDVDRFMEAQQTSTRKSLTEAIAEKIAHKIIHV